MRDDLGRAQPLTELCDALVRAANDSTTEEDLRVRAEHVLQRVVESLGLRYDPRYEKSVTPRSRPDALFGKVVTEYKEPNWLRTRRRVNRAFAQLETYIESVAAEAGEAREQYAGVLTDGYTVGFVRWRDGGWLRLQPVGLSPASVRVWMEYYRALSRKPLLPESLCHDFGPRSNTAHDSIRALLNRLHNPTGKVALLFAEWQRLFGQVVGFEEYQVPEFANVADQYGLEVTQANLARWFFATHTYYALLIKLLTAEILTAQQSDLLESYVARLSLCSPRQLRDELLGLEEGDFFPDHNVDNFLEGDFFSWYLERWDVHLATQVASIVRLLAEYEPATPILRPESVRDLLKELYQELVPRPLRQRLGEFYTPDWLAEMILDEVGYDGDPAKRLIDPNCGSGTFLVLAIQRVLERASRQGLSETDALALLSRNIVGFDLNPLAVITARLNYLLAVRHLLPAMRDRLELPIYLSDSIYSPVPPYTYTLETERGSIQISVPAVLVETGHMPKVLSTIDASIAGGRTWRATWAALQANIRLDRSAWRAAENGLHNLYERVSQLHTDGWNRIWCRIIKNRFASAAVGAFDYVVGNPAWVKWSRLPVSYRDTVREVCKEYNIFSDDYWVGGIESDISTVLTYSAIDKWLADGGRLGYCITQSVFKSRSSQGFRRFALPDGTLLKVTGVHDMVALRPFEGAQNRTAILLLTRAARTRYPVPYSVWTRQGRSALPSSLSLSAVRQRTVVEHQVAVPVSNANNAWLTALPDEIPALRSMRGASAYRGRKATTTDLNNVFWLRITGSAPGGGVRVENNLDSRATQVTKFAGPLESTWLYPLARGREVTAFNWRHDGRYILLPQREMIALPPEEVLRLNGARTLRYLERYRRRLIQRSCFRRYFKRMDAPYYSVWNTGKYTFSRYKVVWREIDCPPAAAVLRPITDPHLGRRIVVPDHKLMMIACDTAGEAHYLCGLINSAPVQRFISSMAVETQVGARAIDDVAVPRFNPEDAIHAEIAACSKALHLIANRESVDDRRARRADALKGRLSDLVTRLFPR